jgi:hypothetical protein
MRRLEVFDLLIVREVPAARQPRPRSACVKLEPILLEAAVTMATSMTTARYTR